MDTAVRNQTLDRLFGNLAAIGIEAGQDDRAGGIVDDEIDAGRELQRADVAPFASDDAALQIVAREIDDRHGCLDRVLGGAALNRFGDVVLGAVDGGLARFGIEPLQQVRGVVARLAFNLFEQQLLRFIRGQAGDPLELALLLCGKLFVLRRRSRRALLAVGDGAVAVSQLFFEPLCRDLALGERRIAAGERLFEQGYLLPLLPGLTFGVHQDVVRLLLCFEERFLLACFRVALGVLRDAERPLFGAADGFGSDPFPVRHPPAEYRGAERHRNGRVDEVFDILHHA